MCIRDSYKGALAGLADALIRDPKAIAACGSVLVETLPGQQWSFFNLFQTFQYTFGQFVRRRAEGIWGKVGLILLFQFHC